LFANDWVRVRDPLPFFPTGVLTQDFSQPSPSYIAMDIQEAMVFTALWIENSSLTLNFKTFNGK
jgi:hypothetical protein